MTNVTAFQTGRTYYTRSACDHDTIFRITVLKRTEKSIWVAGRDGQPKRLGINVYCGVETVKPYGNYSMCAVIGADREIDAPEAAPVAPAAPKVSHEEHARAAVAELLAEAAFVARWEQAYGNTGE